MEFFREFASNPLGMLSEPNVPLLGDRTASRLLNAGHTLLICCNVEPAAGTRAKQRIVVTTVSLAYIL